MSQTNNEVSPIGSDALVLPSLGNLLENWYEGSAYGDHIPKELPKLMAEFVGQYGPTLDEGEAWDIIMESTPDDSWIKLFECIFEQGAKFAMMEIENRDLLRENDRAHPRRDESSNSF